MKPSHLEIDTLATEQFETPLRLIEANHLTRVRGVALTNIKAQWLYFAELNEADRGRNKPERDRNLEKVVIRDIRLRSTLHSSECIYLIDAAERPDIAKVGLSKDPKKRLLTLQTGSPYLLRIRYTYGPFIKSSARQLEDRIHKMLRHSRMSGEWFSISASEIDTVISSEIQKSNYLWSTINQALEMASKTGTTAVWPPSEHPVEVAA